MGILAILLGSCILVHLPLISTLTFCSKVSTGSVYTHEAERSRNEIPIQTLEADKSFQCSIECNILDGCQSFNLISNKTGFEGILCEFFNTSSYISHKDMEMVELKNSTYYEKEFHAKDCVAIRQQSLSSGIYPLEISTNQIKKAFCDMDTGDGGWTLLQRRFDDSVDFYRDWEAYKNGFGDLNGEFWLGLENAHHLMKDTNTTLRFDLWNGTVCKYQEYYNVTIESEDDNYRLSYNGTSGTAGDSMSGPSKDQMFTTKDRDNDINSNTNCAEHYFGAWWYSSCHMANLNGLYGSNTAKGMTWLTFTNYWLSLSKTEIKFKQSFQLKC